MLHQGYKEFLDDDALSELIRLFQQRHLIAHKNGIVDSDYIAKSGDPVYGIGQRIVVMETSVMRLAELILELGHKLRSAIPP